MRYTFVVLLMSCLFSCDYFEKKKLSSDLILSQELKTFRWNDVDQYPSFETCVDSTDLENPRLCFEQTLHHHISNFFNSQHLVVSEAISDTLRLNFMVSKTGDLSISRFSASENTVAQLPNLDSLVAFSLEGLPKLYPAIKRNQEVQTEFQLPLIIQVN